jgi:pyocin large subunit-like protein
MDHFQRHGRELNLVTPDEYEAAAIALFAADLSPTMHECTRPSHDLARWDKVYDRFGVLAKDLFVRTLYLLTPKSGETKMGYFERQCRKN